MTSRMAGLAVVAPSFARATDDEVQEFLRTGTYGLPTGPSGMARKSRPETGVVLRPGTLVDRNAKTGDVSAELLLMSSSNNNDMIPVLASYTSPWPLATGSVFDVECRDLNTGEVAFLAVSKPLEGKTLGDLSDAFFVQELTKPSGRFSLYGQPTDLVVKHSTATTRNNIAYRQFDLNVSTLSQSTQAELPRRARIVATIPKGTDQAVLLVASASASKWKNGANDAATAVAESFLAIPAPATALKMHPEPAKS